MQSLYIENIVNEFPPQIQMPVRHLIEWIQTERSITREDFSELKLAIQDLTVAQAHTDQRIEKLAQAQDRTEQMVQKLVQAQERTEKRIDKLEESTEQLKERTGHLEESVEQLKECTGHLEESVEQLKERTGHLEESVEQLKERTGQLEERVEFGFKSLSDQIAALGSRWGIYNEGTFRSTIRGLLRKMEGVTIEEGFYGGRQVDVVVRNGEHLILEITSRMHAKDIDKLYKSADEYREKTGIEPNLMVATSYISPGLMQKIMVLERRIEIFSYESDG